MEKNQNAPIGNEELKSPGPMTGDILSEADPAELPENAFRELAADENYRPIMHPAREYREVTVYSVSLGLILAISSVRQLLTSV